MCGIPYGGSVMEECTPKILTSNLVLCNFEEEKKKTAEKGK